MTTHTDRKSGFGDFPAKGAQPLPTEPVQVHEDPGAAYWKEATKMAEHTDRIRQMAQEAGYRAETASGDAVIITYEQLTRFAQLVAEDCARTLEVLCAGQSAPSRKEMEASAKNIADWFRARYIPKD